MRALASRKERKEKDVRVLEPDAAAGAAEELVGEADVAAHGAHGGAAGHLFAAERRPGKARLRGLDEAGVWLPTEAGERKGWQCRSLAKHGHGCFKYWRHESEKCRWTHRDRTRGPAGTQV